MFRHVGRGNRWAAQIVADRRDTALDPREVREGKPPDDMDAAIDWLNAGAALILDSVDDVGADTEVWTFIGPRPAQWWIRRRLHEATVHKADAAIALGIDVELAPEVAADGIDEWLERVAVETRRRVLAAGRRAGLCICMPPTTPSGPQGEWTITGTGDGVAWSHEHGKGDVALRGRATDLLLAVVRRKSTADGGIEVFGDTAVWDGWLDRTPF